MHLFENKWWNDLCPFLEVVGAEAHDDMACVNFGPQNNGILSTLKIFANDKPPFSMFPSEGEDKFSGATMTFTIHEANLAKSRCDVSYDCTEVTRLDGAMSSIECSDLAFDSSTGAFTFSADSEDYVNGTFTAGEYQVVVTHSAM